MLCVYVLLFFKDTFFINVFFVLFFLNILFCILIFFSINYFFLKKDISNFIFNRLTIQILPIYFCFPKISQTMDDQVFLSSELEKKLEASMNFHKLLVLQLTSLYWNYATYQIPTKQYIYYLMPGLGHHSTQENKSYNICTF